MISAKNIRVSALMLLLFTLAFFAIRDLYPLWDDKTININIHLSNPEGSQEVNTFINNVEPDHFKEVEYFLTKNAKFYSKKEVRFKFIILGKVKNKIPTGFFKKNIQANSLWPYWVYDIKEIIKLRLYVLKDRWNSGRGRGYDVYVNYYSDDENAPTQSLAFQVGTFAILNLHADESMKPYDNVIVAHEILHFFGANDRYDETLNPIYPVGYAEPYKIPTFPQNKAEIMGGYIPISKNNSVAATLDEVVINPITAKEVMWIKPFNFF